MSTSKSLKMSFIVKFIQLYSSAETVKKATVVFSIYLDLYKYCLKQRIANNYGVALFMNSKSVKFYFIIPQIDFYPDAALIYICDPSTTKAC